MGTDLTAKILKCFAELAPEPLDVKGNFNVISQHVGLRLSKAGGVRIETETLSAEGLGDANVAYCYENGGDG